MGRPLLNAPAAQGCVTRVELVSRGNNVFTALITSDVDLAVYKCDHIEPIKTSI